MTNFILVVAAIFVVILAVAAFTWVLTVVGCITMQSAFRFIEWLEHTE